MKHLSILSNLNLYLCFSNYYILILTLFVLIFNSCSSPFVNLPTYDNVHTDPYGAMITIRYRDNVNKGHTSVGELISVENDSIYVLTKENGTYKNKYQESYKIIAVNQNKTTSYKVVFANSEPNGVFLASGLLTLAHGFFILTSVPINVVIGALVMGEEKYLYSFTHRQVSVDDLFKFCRFPSGIPSNIDLKKLRLSPVKK